MARNYDVINLISKYLYSKKAYAIFTDIIKIVTIFILVKQSLKS